MEDLLNYIAMAGAGALLYGIPVGIIYFALTWLQYRNRKRTNEIEAANRLRKQTRVVFWSAGLCASVLLFLVIIAVRKPAPDFGGNAALIFLLGLGFVVLLALVAFFTGLILLPSRIPPNGIGLRRNPKRKPAPPLNCFPEVAQTPPLSRGETAPKFDFFDQPRSRQALQVAFGVFIYFLLGLYWVLQYTAHSRDEIKLKIWSSHPSDCKQTDLDAMSGACRGTADARCYERFRLNLRCLRLKDAHADLQVLCEKNATCEHRSSYQTFDKANRDCDSGSLSQCRSLLKMQREAGANFSIATLNPFLCDRGDPDACYTLSGQYQTEIGHAALARSCNLGSNQACAEFTCEKMFIFLKWPVLFLTNPGKRFPHLYSWRRQCGPS